MDDRFDHDPSARGADPASRPQLILPSQGGGGAAAAVARRTLLGLGLVVGLAGADPPEEAEARRRKRNKPAFQSG